MPNGRVSQIVAEILSAGGASNGRSSQVVAEVQSQLSSSTVSNGRISQVVAEVFSAISVSDDNVRVSQIVAEVFSAIVTFANYKPVFPDVTFSDIPGRGWTQHKRPTFATIENDTSSGRATRSPQQNYPLWEYELTFEVLRSETQNQEPYTYYQGLKEFEAISELFLFCNGQGGSFLYNDPDDNSRLGQEIATGDSNTHIFPIVRTWGYGDLSFTEIIGGINEIQNVYFDDVLQSSDLYTVIYGNYIWFSSAPPSGVTITMDFTFYYLCRFLEDQHDYEEFLKNLWSIQSVKFRSMYGTS